jgi:hypothetical protein
MNKRAPKITIHTSSGSHTFQGDTTWFRVYVIGGGRDGDSIPSPWTGRSGTCGGGSMAVMDIASGTAAITVGSRGDTAGGLSRFVYGGRTITGNGGVEGTDFGIAVASGGDVDVYGTRAGLHKYTSSSNYPNGQEQPPFFSGWTWGAGGEGVSGSSVVGAGKDGVSGAVIVEEYA